MPSASNVGLFAIAALALLVIPGPSVLYVVTRSVEQGRRAGLVSVLGLHTGSLVHIAAAATGLSALLLIGDRLRARAKARGPHRQWSGLVLIGLGIFAATTRRPAPAS